jgi:hypothetical protein
MKEVGGQNDGKGVRPPQTFAEKGEEEDRGVVAYGNEQGRKKKEDNSATSNGGRGEAK